MLKLDSQVESTDHRQMLSQKISTVKQQQQQHEGDHMLALHSKLHQEADKIRKWKIQTELDLKDKVCAIILSLFATYCTCRNGFI